QTLLAPVDHHAADRGIRLHRNLGILELAGAHDLEAGALDLGDDLVEADPLEVVGVEHGSGEQEIEALEIVHAGPRKYPGKAVGLFDDSWMTEASAGTREGSRQDKSTLMRFVPKATANAMGSKKARWVTDCPRGNFGGQGSVDAEREAGHEPIQAH